MSINTEVHIERRWLNEEPYLNNPYKPSPFTNDLLSRLEFVNPLFVTLAGKYERIVRLPEPTMAWHPASKGATERFKGCLGEIFPELKDLSPEEFKKIERMRNKV